MSPAFHHAVRIPSLRVASRDVFRLFYFLSCRSRRGGSLGLRLTAS